MFPNEIVDCLHLVGNRTNNPYGFRLRLFCVWLLWPSCVFGAKEDALLLAKDNGIRKAETIIHEVAESISHFRQYAEECKVSQQWIGAVETTLKSHLADWGLSEQRKDISFSIDGMLFENVRVERTYKGNYHLLCEANGKERKFVITNKKDEYVLIDKVGIDNLTKEQLSLLVKKFLAK